MCNITHSVLEKRRCEVSRKLITKSQVYGCTYSTRGEFRKFVKVYLTKFLDLVVCQSLSSCQFTTISLEKYKKSYLKYIYDM